MEKIKNKIKSLWNSGAIHIIIGSFATKFVTLFGSVFLVRLMSKNDYGLLSYIENLYSFVFLLGGLGVANGTLRYVVLGRTLEEKKGFYNYFLRVSIVINIIIIILMNIVNIFYTHPADYSNSKVLLGIMLISLPFQYIFENNLATERAMFQYKQYAFLSFACATGVIFGKLVGAFLGDITGVILVTLGVYCFFGLFSTYKVEKQLFHDVKIEKLNKTIKKDTLIYSIQFMFVNGLWTLFMLSDVFLMGKLGVSPTELADYKIAYVWPANISIVGSCIATFVTPYFVKNENNYSWVKKNFAIVYLGNFLITLVIAIGVFALSKPLILLYAGQKYLNTIPLMRTILVGAVINNGLRMITANTFSAMGKVKYNMVVSIFAFCMQIILNVKFIPILGVYSVAYTSIVVYSFMAIVLLAVFIKEYYLIKK